MGVALALPLVCYSGPMDGEEVPAGWVRDGSLVKGIVGSLYYPLKEEGAVPVWVWSRVPSAAERVVIYLLNSAGDRLLFEGYANF